MKVLRGLFGCGMVFWMGGYCLAVFLPNLLVSLTVPQMPFGGAELTRWQLGVPQDSDAHVSDGSVPAGGGRVGRDGYRSADAQPPWGLPLRGPIRHWGREHDRPLLGCGFQDPHYATHTGVDFPVEAGTPVYATMGGKVVWAGENGPWGLLVVVENGDYQTWFAHNESLSVQVGDLVDGGQVIAASGNTGNSTGPHVHYGIKQFQDDGDTTGAWLDPELFFALEEVLLWPCGN